MTVGRAASGGQPRPNDAQGKLAPAGTGLRQARHISSGTLRRVGPDTKAAIVGIPFDCGTRPDRIGSRMGPAAIRVQSSNLRRFDPRQQLSTCCRRWASSASATCSSRRG